MKILVISGFLGAGKTTFIRELVRRNAGEIAVFENEYGSVGVDGAVLKNSAETGQVNIWEMAEGCICCSMKGDFTASVLTIANTVDPDYLVIEPTGVGMLSNVTESLKRIAYERIQISALSRRIYGTLSGSDSQCLVSCDYQDGTGIRGRSAAFNRRIAED